MPPPRMATLTPLPMPGCDGERLGESGALRHEADALHGDKGGRVTAGLADAGEEVAPGDAHVLRAPLVLWCTVRTGTGRASATATETAKAKAKATVTATTGVLRCAQDDGVEQQLRGSFAALRMTT